MSVISISGDFTTNRQKCFGVAQRSLQGASVSQQVMALLAGGEQRLPHADHPTSDPGTVAGVLHQRPANGSVHLVPPGREDKVCEQQ